METSLQRAPETLQRLAAEAASGKQIANVVSHGVTTMSGFDIHRRDQRRAWARGGHALCELAPVRRRPDNARGEEGAVRGAPRHPPPADCPAFADLTLNRRTEDQTARNAEYSDLFDRVFFR